MRLFRLVAVAEGLAFPALLVAATLHLVLPDGKAVLLLGALHGALWTSYLPLVVLVRRRFGWTRTTTAVALIASLVPFGTWWVERHWGRA